MFIAYGAIGDVFQARVNTYSIPNCRMPVGPATGYCYYLRAYSETIKSIGFRLPWFQAIEHALNSLSFLFLLIQLQLYFCFFAPAVGSGATAAGILVLVLTRP